MKTEQLWNLPASDSVEVEVSNTQSHLAVDQAWVINLVRRVLNFEGVHRASISVAIVDDASIRVINARFLSHDWATDVISFRLSDENDLELAGELIISAEMAVNTATQAHCEPPQEFALYLVHGLLHLCGYNDQADDDVAVIRDREARVLDSLGMESPLVRVTSSPVISDDSGRESVRWPR